MDSATKIPGRYVYFRVGYDWRPVELLPNGLIGEGAAGAERRWRVTDNNVWVPAARANCLLIEGDAGLIAALVCDWDGIWRGQWTQCERMPIELVPIRAPRGPDWRLVRTRGDGMYWIVEEGFTESALGLRDHEDWMWQHIPIGRDVVFVDVGAFIGTYTVWASRRCGKVIAFEPHSTHHALLRRNLVLNGCTNAETVETAVGDETTKVSMSAPDPASYVQVGRLGDIPQATLDDLLAGMPRVDCIKIDVEGAEVRVVQGALGVLQKHHPRLLIEVHSHYQNCEHNGSQIADLIEPLGYTLRRIFQNRSDYYYLRCEICK